MKLKFLITILISFYTLLSLGQSSLIMSNPVSTNGGFAGNLGNERISSNFYTNPLSKKSSNTNYLSYGGDITFDFLSKKLKGGFAISVYSDNSYSTYTRRYNNDSLVKLDNGNFYQKETYYSTNEVNRSNQGVTITYSPKFILKQKFAFSPFISTSVSNHSMNNVVKRVDNGALLRGGTLFGFNQKFYNELKYYSISSSMGFLLNKENWFFGYSNFGFLNHKKRYGDFRLADREIDFTVPKYFQKIYHQLQFGKYFKLDDKNKLGFGVYAQNTISYKANNPYSPFKLDLYQLSRINLSFKYANLIVGVNTFKNHYSSRSYEFGIAYKFERIRIGYGANFGFHTHQLGFQYIFKKDEDKDKLLSIPIR